MRIVDLRSDTVTKPTPCMREAMRNAKVGDDVLGGDPTVNLLQEKAAEKVGKEDALFVASGVMGNLIAIMVHTRPGDEVICDKDSHVNTCMTGGTGRVAGVTTWPLNVDRNGRFDLEELEDSIKPDDTHYPRTSLITFENTNNHAGGTILTPEDIQNIADIGHKHGLSVHLDGARLFNAAVAQGVDVKRLTTPVDSVMFCISKGLASPVGSLLTGTKEFIREARRVRKMLGGGMRQAGVLAACGIISLDEMIDRLSEDHENAHKLAEEMANIRGISLDLESVQTNIIYFDFNSPSMTCKQYIKEIGERGVLALHFHGTRARMVTHKDVNSSDIDHALSVINSVALAA